MSKLFNILTLLSYRIGTTTIQNNHVKCFPILNIGGTQDFFNGSRNHYCKIALFCHKLMYLLMI